jgi:hypothetical protein
MTKSVIVRYDPAILELIFLAARWPVTRMTKSVIVPYDPAILEFLRLAARWQVMRMTKSVSATLSSYA